MLIIWGTKGFEKVLGMTKQPYQCSHCGNANYYKIVRQRVWFTLFWIPLFPVSTKYYVLCPICDFGSKLKKDEALAMVSEEGNQS